MPNANTISDILSTDQQSDEQLVQLIRTTDQEMYRVLVERYQDKLLRYAQRLLNSEQNAQDIVQQAFIKAFVNLNNFDTKRKFSSWIYRIVHNEAVNYIKKTHRETKLDQSYLENTKDEKLDDFIQTMTKREEQETFVEYLGKLPIEYKSPLTLYYYAEKSYKEISDILRIPIGTVSTRINRGKTALKKIHTKNNGLNQQQ